MPWDPFGDPSDDKHEGWPDINTLIFPYLKQAIQEIREVEHHIHNRERWFGISADQSGDNWAELEGLNPFRAISGAGDFGSDPDDEAKVFGSADSPTITDMTMFDCQEIVIAASSNANPWIIRIIWGTGTMADAEAAGQYTSEMFTEAKKGTPIDFHNLRLATGTKIWVRGKNGTNNATIDFFIGKHEYDDPA